MDFTWSIKGTCVLLCIGFFIINELPHVGGDRVTARPRRRFPTTPPPPTPTHTAVIQPKTGGPVNVDLTKDPACVRLVASPAGVIPAPGLGGVYVKTGTTPPCEPGTSVYGHTTGNYLLLKVWFRSAYVWAVVRAAAAVNCSRPAVLVTCNVLIDPLPQSFTCYDFMLYNVTVALAVSVCPDPCAPPAANPCANGQCLTDERYEATCACNAGWRGDTCSEEILECASTPCGVGGTCEERINGYTCRCALGYEGTNCEVFKACLSSPCRNGGVCNNRGDQGYSCTCVGGYEGQNCQFETMECASNPCDNNGTCLERVNGYGCMCLFGYVGRTCSVDTWWNPIVLLVRIWQWLEKIVITVEIREDGATGQESRAVGEPTTTRPYATESHGDTEKGRDESEGGSSEEERESKDRVRQASTRRNPGGRRG